jgi:hypothetical protein
MINYFDTTEKIEIENKHSYFYEIQESYYENHDFFVINEISSDILFRVAKDNNFVVKLNEIYPSNGSISNFGDDYKLLCVCHKNEYNNIINLLKIKYNITQIFELIEPKENFVVLQNLFIKKILFKKKWICC